MDPTAPPWTDDSIYQLIRSHLDPLTGRLTGQLDLPDEAAREPGRMRFAAGAEDGIATHHMGFRADEERAQRLAGLLDRAAREADAAAVAEAHRLLCEAPVLGLVDPLIEQLAERQTPVDPLQSLAHSLATRTAHRDPVKAGIALLGAAGATCHQDVVMTLGRHDEFTLYAAVALLNMLDRPGPALFDLARHVEGWGRIHAVERMQPAGDAQAQRWLRTEGFRNSIMPEYLALKAATGGQLLTALEQPSLPPQELTDACEIIRVLIDADGAPADGMNAYGDGAAACLELLRHLEAAAPELPHYLAVRAIQDHLERLAEGDAAGNLRNGWSESATARVRSQAQALAARPVWGELVRASLDGDDERQFQLADWCAKRMGMGTFPWHWRRLQSRPLDVWSWSRLMEQVKCGQIDEVLELAGAHLPLSAIATGPGKELGLGREFEAHSCLDSVLQTLRSYPGRGRTLILAGLRSPVVRNRSMAVAALAAWEPPQRADLRAVIERALQEEVDDKLKERIAELLEGGSDASPPPQG